jgi:glycosyltransferase involved in cell wall biosynthesis
MNLDVVIPARNESENLPHVLGALQNQTHRADRTILVDDRSTDSTVQIAKQFHVDEVVQITGDPNYRHPPGSPSLTRVFNKGLERVSANAEWVMILGGDHVLDANYVETVMRHMNEDDAMLASGAIRGEPTETPRGSGRITSVPVWKELFGKLAYRQCFGYESYAVAKFEKAGYKTAMYEDALSSVRRFTSNNTNFVNYGRGMKFLGYPFERVISRAAATVIRQHRPISAIQLMSGYLTYREISDVADFICQNPMNRFQWVRNVAIPHVLARKLFKWHH